MSLGLFLGLFLGLWTTVGNLGCLPQLTGVSVEAGLFHLAIRHFEQTHKNKHTHTQTHSLVRHAPTTPTQAHSQWPPKVRVHPSTHAQTHTHTFVTNKSVLCIGAGVWESSLDSRPMRAVGPVVNSQDSRDM